MQKGKVPIASLLDAYLREAHLKHNENVLRYWASMAVTIPDLQKLEMRVIVSPVMQVSMERTFSCLKFIFSPLRSSLSEKVLEDILFIRLNI